MNKYLNQFFGITAALCVFLASSCTFENGGTASLVTKTLEITPAGLKKLDGDTLVLSNTGEKQIMTIQTTIEGSDLYANDTGSDPAQSYGVFIKDRTVILSPFIMGQYEVTQELYGLVMGNNPSDFQGMDPLKKVASDEMQMLRPVENVTWYDAIEFCNKLSEKTGLNPVYAVKNREPATGYPITKADVTVDLTKNGYRLPTEAEWEFAARGGEPNTDEGAVWRYPYAGTETNIHDVAWFWDESPKKTHQTAKKAKNKLDLYDMTGNVSEWCFDRYKEEFDKSTQLNPYNDSAGENRVNRGGSWHTVGGKSTVSFRASETPGLKNDKLGFRLCRTVVK